MTFVSLFAGIGGFDLGLERAGHECVGQVEINPFATRVLEKHWPNVPRIADVKEYQGHEFGPFNMLVGGYPCQPFSTAGNRRGEHDERHLWPEVHRIIRNVRPQYVLLENVPGHLSLGFGRVLGDLAESGYDASWDCIPAAAVGAPHRRDRVFILAYADSNGRSRDQAVTDQRQSRSAKLEPSSSPLAYPQSEHGNGGSNHRECRPEPRPQLGNGRPPTRPDSPWEVPEPPVRGGLDGLPHRVDRLRTLGNAVVPQVAEWIGRNLPQ